jgi:hypothetical protein
VLRELCFVARGGDITDAIDLREFRKVSALVYLVQKVNYNGTFQNCGGDITDAIYLFMSPSATDGMPAGGRSCGGILSACRGDSAESPAPHALSHTHTHT